jgi:nucleotide-binding universal stress UspA family protein
MFSPRTILFPTDLSPASWLAFGLAADVAHRYGASLLVLYVVETLGPENVTFGEVATELEPEGYRKRLVAELEANMPASPGVAVETLLAAGDPAAEVVRVAQERPCELIVMATHGRTGVRRLVLGSVAERVVRTAPCPVLTLRCQGAD